VNIRQIEEALKNEDASPPDLAKLNTILAGYYSYYGQMLKRIQLKKPEIWLQIQDYEVANDVEHVKRPKPLSDKKLSVPGKPAKKARRKLLLSGG
jgi:hypothetical protein